MFVSSAVAYDVKRYLHRNKGIVVPFKPNDMNPVFSVTNYMVHKALRTLASKNYVEKIGNWQHAWYFVTEDGEKMLRTEVGLPNESREEERQEIKN